MLAGGQGSRTAVHNVTLLDWLRNTAAASSKPLTFLASVCTGSAILAKAGDVGAASLTDLAQPPGFPHQHGGSRSPRLLSVAVFVKPMSHAGLLDGKKATTNKQAFPWVRSQSDQVNWMEDVRWVVVRHLLPWPS